MKELWDEFDCHTSNMTMIKLKSMYHLMQFLASLHEGYKHAKQQILLMEPRSSVSKVYFILLGVESSMNNKLTSTVNLENTSAMLVPAPNQNIKETWKQKQLMDKSKLYCEHCKKKGLLKASRFELVGYIDWFKDLKKNRSNEKKYGNHKNPHEFNVFHASISKLFIKSFPRCLIPHKLLIPHMI